jgi:hypothetical protein
MKSRTSQSSSAMHALQIAKYTAMIAGGVAGTLWILSYIRPWRVRFPTLSIGSENGVLIAAGPNGDLFWLMMVPYWVPVLISAGVAAGCYALQIRVRRKGLRGGRGFPVE